VNAVNWPRAITIDTDGATDANAGTSCFRTNTGTVGTINGAQTLTLDASADGTNRNGGNVQFGTVGDTTRLTGLTVKADGIGLGTNGTLTLKGNISTEAGAVDFANVSKVVLASDVTIDTDNSAASGAAGGGDLQEHFDDQRGRLRCRLTPARPVRRTKVVARWPLG